MRGFACFRRRKIIIAAIKATAPRAPIPAPMPIPALAPVDKPLVEDGFVALVFEYVASVA
jgi:hypothetical protein